MHKKVTEQFTIRRDCGLKMMYEKCEDGSFQGLLFGRSDFHVKMSVSQENKKESSEEHGADYFLKLCGSLMKRKIINPDGLSLKTLKICSLLRGGWGFFTVLSEMEARGYSIEWKVYNSKDYGVPQNRERVYIAGYLGRRGERALLPTARKSERVLKQVIGGAQGERVYEPNLSCTLSSQGGGSGAKTGLYIVGKIPEYSQRGVVYADGGNVGSLTATDYKSPPKVMEKKFTGLSNAAGKSGVCAVLTPDRINKRQNGRRIKEDGEPAFTITTEDRHGVMLNDGNMCYIRKLTPKECWRLQGFTDDQYEKAAAVNSKSQLYKQAGNAVTVNVTYEIGQHIMDFKKDGGDEA